jgi:hypothetical protein
MHCCSTIKTRLRYLQMLLPGNFSSWILRTASSAASSQQPHLLLPLPLQQPLPLHHLLSPLLAIPPALHQLLQRRTRLVPLNFRHQLQLLPNPEVEPTEALC